MTKLLIVADDFTGALDTGVQFSKKGISTVVTTQTKAACGNGDVLVIDIESRHLPADKAAERVKEAVESARNFGAEYYFKKTDSTLRGNIGAELGAFMEVLGSRELMFLPAYPKTGRTTVGGAQYVDGIPLHRTMFAKDPLNPVTESTISQIIESGYSGKCHTVRSDQLNGELFKMESGGIYIFDSAHDDELKKAAAFIKEAGKLKVTAGCGGVAEFLPELMDLPKSEINVSKKRPDTLVVCGSVSETSINQIKHGESLGYRSVALKPQQILQEAYFETRQGMELVEQIRALMSADKKIILKTVQNREQVDDYIEYGRLLGIRGDAIHINIAKNLGNLVKKIVSVSPVGNLVVFGGDTSLYIMEALKCHSLAVKDEIVPGVPVSEFSYGKENRTIVTKAGGFGGEQVLSDIFNYLKSRSSSFCNRWGTGPLFS